MQSVIVHINESGITNPKAVKTFFNSLKPGKWLIEGREISKRTLPQNDYLHVLFTMLVEPLREAGWNNIRRMEDAKEFVKALFLTVEIENEKTGDKVKRIKGTSELSKMEMIDFIDEMKQWAAEYLGFYLPDPNQPMPLFKNEVV